MMNKKASVLFVDDEPAILEGIIRALHKENFELYTVHSAKEALEFLESHAVDAVVADHFMPGMKGLDLLREISIQYPLTLRLILTGHQDGELAQQAIHSGVVFRFITKPCQPFDLAISIRQGLYQQALEHQNQTLKQAISPPTLHHLWMEQSEVMKILSKQIHRIANLDSTILITGESGTGKTSIAHLIHESSSRSAYPFISVNCAALPRDLIESELFGHERGAFTGAISSRPGRIELAEHGTLFLDEIGDMPLELQPKILTFLDDRRVQRIGGRESRKINVRVIAATNQDLAGKCQSRYFREDLYYRLNVFSLHIPPLRSRQKDLSQLINTILHKIAQSRGRSPYCITSQAHRELLAYPWPGNIRELENLLERASAFCDDSQITHLDLGLSEQGSASQVPSSLHTSQSPTKTLEELEQDALLMALEQCQGNKAAVARRLGISEKSVYNKIKRLHLTPFHNFQS